MPRILTWPSLVGADKLPRPWELPVKQAPLGFKIPTVPTPHELLEEFPENAPQTALTAEERKAARQHRLQTMLDNQAEWDKYQEELRNGMSNVNIDDSEPEDDIVDDDLPLNSADRDLSMASAYLPESENEDEPPLPPPLAEREPSLELGSWSQFNNNEEQLPPVTNSQPVSISESSNGGSRLKRRLDVNTGHNNKLAALNSGTKQIRSRGDMFDIPESDPVEVDQVINDAPFPARPATSNHIVRPSATSSYPTAVDDQDAAAAGPSNRNKTNDGRTWVHTIQGMKPVVKIPHGKKIERLLERGNDGKRVWYLCKFVGEPEATAEPIHQTNLKKVPNVANMIKAWEKAKKGSR